MDKIEKNGASLEKQKKKEKVKNMNFTWIITFFALDISYDSFWEINIFKSIS